MKKIITVSFLMISLKIGACEMCVHSIVERLEHTKKDIQKSIDNLPKDAFEIMQYYHPDMNLTFKEYEDFRCK